MFSPRVALATAEHLPDLSADEQQLLLALRARGIRAEPLVWSAAPEALPDAVLIRTCWDYHLRVDEFFRWVDHLDAAGVVVLNPPPLLRWNAHKRYLERLAGVVSVPPLVWFQRGSQVRDIALPAEWRRAVIKPAISASAYETWVADLPLGDADRERLRALCLGGDVLAQRFVHEITSEGELSFVFIEGHYSHAVRKRPASGDFRVQAELGGGVAVETPASHDIRTASAVVAAIPEIPLYARVDAVVTPHAFHLMELELIDPQLFFHEAAHPIGDLADAVLARIRSRSPG